MKNYIKIITTLSVFAFQLNAQNMIFTQDITASRAFNGVFGSATLQIDDAGNDGMITRPLIIAEGFESGLLGSENPFGENDIKIFSRRVNLGQSNNLEFFLTGGTVNTTGDQDYDIIYVNWDNGRDDLRRNAYVLQEVIRWVNQEKADVGSIEQNVVLGQSMGGLIARYALADMEQDSSQNHDTRLYISHDAPHQGANIPISIQYLARHLADQYVGTPVGDLDLPAAGGGSVTISDIQNVFNSTGTQQMLANNINGSFSLDNDAFNSFQADLQAKGYPQQTRNIAISNGSHCANDQEIQALQELLYLSGEIEPTILLDIIINYFPFLATLEGLGYLGLAIVLEDPAYLAGLLPGRTNLNARFEAKSLPNVGQSANIYRGRIRITKKINFILFTLTYNINVTDRDYNNPSAVQLPLDSYPGGAFNVPFDLSEINSSTNNWLINLNMTGRSADSFNFIPTPSALDVGGGSTTINDTDYKRVYNAANPPTGNRAIPFDNFTSSFNLNGTNERHISFNTRNGDWLATELDTINGNENVFDCSAFCVDAEIIGEHILCTSGIYSVTDMATIVNWTVIDPDNLVSFTTNNNEITLNQLNPNNFGIVTLEVYYYNPRCGSVTVTKDIEVGILPNRVSNASLTGETSVCDGQFYTYTINGANHPCITSINWSVSPNLTIVSQNATSVTVTTTLFNDLYAGVITANIANSDIVIEKGVWVGTPTSDGLVIQKIGRYDLYAERWSKLRAVYSPLIYQAHIYEPLDVTFEWQIPYSIVRNYSDTAYKDVKPRFGGQLNIGVRAVCECGNGEWQYRLFDVGGGNGVNELIPPRKSK